MDGDKAAPPADADGHAEDRISRAGPAPGGEPRETDARRARARLRAGVIGVVVLAILGGAGTLYWLHARNFETTDDAFIDGHITQMGAQVAGRVTALLVADNQHVTAGQPLVSLDRRDYQVKLDQMQARRANAAAGVQQARAQLALQQANLDQTLASVRVAESDLEQAQQDYGRYKAVDPHAITRQLLDTATSTLRGSEAKLEASRQAANAARAQIEAAKAQVAAAEASLREADADVENAQLQLSYTTLIAPAAGRFTKRSVEVGNYVMPGQSLFAIVQDGLWVTANFKETQLALMRPGQPVEVAVDAFGGPALRAHVDSFQTGTGAIFSALPAENATGNYVHVVQRLPVKVVFDDARASELPLAPGMSVVPTVTVR